MAKILLVEDDPILLKFYHRLFENQKSDNQVTLASGGQAALDIFTKQDFDLIALDVMMPVMNGIQVLEKIKATPKGKDVTVVMLTAFSDSGMVAECVKKGATGFIIKSEVEPEKLMVALEGYFK
ncbi:MAG TPA: response regulator [Patescibacteria group bacterium]|nr:response regulator [Patescibacteria group bacterium]